MKFIPYGTCSKQYNHTILFNFSKWEQPTAEESVIQAFHILNNFDIPTGTEFAWGKSPADVPSGTQFTVASDTHNCKIYYRTMYNSNIRCIDLKSIDFDKVKYQAEPLDRIKKEPIEMVSIK